MEVIGFVVLVGFFSLDGFSYREQSVSGWHLGKEAGRTRRDMPQGGTEPWPHQQHRNGFVSRAGAGNGPSAAPGTAGDEPAPGPSTGSWQGQKQKGQSRAGVQVQRLLSADGLPTAGSPRTNCRQRWSPARPQHSSDQNQHYWADPKWSLGQEGMRAPGEAPQGG